MSLDQLTQQLINDYQSGFPLCARPFLQLAEQFGVTEQQVIERLEQLKHNGVLSRLGPVFDHQRVGASTLAAVSVPTAQLDEIAQVINQFEGVNHNYAREHQYNLWFVVTAPTQALLSQTLAEIEQQTNTSVLVLPMEQAYHIDLSFKIDFTPLPRVMSHA